MSRYAQKVSYAGKGTSGVPYTIRFDQDAWIAFNGNGDPANVAAAHKSIGVLKKFLGIKSFRVVKTDPQATPETRAPVAA